MARRLSAVFAVVALAGGCSGHAADPGLKGITSVLVARHGKLVSERYYGGTRASDRLPVFSITKSVTSALVGIAIGRGELTGAGERLPWRPRIALRQLLSMTAGYSGRTLSFGPSDPAALARRPLVDPGRFAYDSGSFKLLTDVLARATGMPAADYARRRLFGPMGIRDVRWPGSRGSSGLLLRPRDLLAFGQLYLDGGVYHGKRIVPASWVRDSTRAHTQGYGYGWWVHPHSYAAWGYLGQVLAVFPQRDEVVLVTSSREDSRSLELVRRLARG